MPEIRIATEVFWRDDLQGMLVGVEQAIERTLAVAEQAGSDRKTLAIYRAGVRAGLAGVALACGVAIMEPVPGRTRRAHSLPTFGE